MCQGPLVNWIIKWQNFLDRSPFSLFEVWAVNLETPSFLDYEESVPLYHKQIFVLVLEDTRYFYERPSVI